MVNIFCFDVLCLLKNSQSLCRHLFILVHGNYGSKATSQSLFLNEPLILLKNLIQNSISAYEAKWFSSSCLLGTQNSESNIVYDLHMKKKTKRQLSVQLDHHYLIGSNFDRTNPQKRILSYIMLTSTCIFLFLWNLQWE